MWWGAWIVGNILSSVSMRIMLMDDGTPASVTAANVVGLAGTVVSIVAAVLLMKLIAGVTAAQRGGSSAVPVFA